MPMYKEIIETAKAQNKLNLEQKQLQIFNNLQWIAKVATDFASELNFKISKPDSYRYSPGPSVELSSMTMITIDTPLQITIDYENLVLRYNRKFLPFLNETQLIEILKTYCIEVLSNLEL